MVLIPTGISYTSTVTQDFIFNCTCEKCATSFSYEGKLQGQGTDSSPLFLRNAGAKNQATLAAEKDLKTKIEKGLMPPFPCPQCGWYQISMVKYLKATRYAFILKLGLKLLFIVLALTAFLGLVATESGGMQGILLFVANPVFWLVVSFPLAMVTGVLLARYCLNPNRKHQQYRTA